MGMETQNSVKRRDAAIDMLKWISIAAVVLYHMGVLKSGYLGVDCFFVVGGFLTMPRIIKGVETGEFRFFTYLRGRLVRLLPSVLLASVVSLLIGFVLWLPNDYENLSESVVASVLFSNNILAGITTKNYWDVINEYKPLMHMWYLGILMEYYVLTPLLAAALNRIAGGLGRDRRRTMLTGMGVVTAVSFALFLMPSFTAGDKFYFIPFRFWELSLGGFVGVFRGELTGFLQAGKRRVAACSFGIILLILCIGLANFDPARIGVATTIIGADYVASSDLILPNGVLLTAMVLATCLFLAADDGGSLFNRSRILSALGRRSFSIFVWHQVLLALGRYSVTSKLSVLSVIVFLALTAAVSELNYRVVESGVRDTGRTAAVLLAAALVTCGYSGWIYLRAGVVRDVPELGISTACIQRNIHSEYCDRVYACKDAFEDNGKINVLVVGNSFARDWGNILLESGYGGEINLYFSPHFNDSLRPLIPKADRIFVFENYEDKVPQYVWESVDSDIVYCIGTKNFGITNGTVYARRFSEDYFRQTAALDPGYAALNLEKREKWGDHYIDLIEPVLVDGRVRVFTDDDMFLSQDCRHLTEAGAKYYARVLELSEYLPPRG